MKNLKIAKLNENQNLIFTVFLLLLSFFINRNINKKNKLILLLLGLIVCIYKPLMVIPFNVFLITLFYACKKKKVVEGFEDNDEKKLYNLLITKNDETKKYFKYFDKNHKSFIEFNKLLEEKQGETNYSKVKYNYDLYVKFFDIYFFNPNEENDWDLINKILDNTNKTDFKDIIEELIISEENSSIDNYLKKEPEEEYILYKNLGLFFYREAEKDYLINNQILNLINFMGLQKIYVGEYKGNNTKRFSDPRQVEQIVPSPSPSPSIKIIDVYDEIFTNHENILIQDELLNNQYEIIQKRIYELGILHYKSIAKKNYISNVANKYLEFKPYLLFTDNYNKIQKKYFRKIYLDLTKYKLIRNPVRDNEKESKISNLVDKDKSYGLFYTKKNNKYNKINYE